MHTNLRQRYHAILSSMYTKLYQQSSNSSTGKDVEQPKQRKGCEGAKVQDMQNPKQTDPNTIILWQNQMKKTS